MAVSILTALCLIVSTTSNHNKNAVDRLKALAELEKLELENREKRTEIEEKVAFAEKRYHDQFRPPELKMYTE